MIQVKKEQRTKNNLTVVIPALEPTVALVEYTKELIIQGFSNVIVINDGSSEQYNTIFECLEQINDCTVIRHKKNKGKGSALKSGYKFIKEKLPACQGVITADSDGQHCIDDVCKMAQELVSANNCLILGCRNFSLPSIPPKSRIGNRLSSSLFFLLYGKWIGDTQTGLRGISASLLEEMLQMDGERFEYEMEVITSCILKKIPIKQIEIQTIYENNNESTHFQAFHDSVRIGKVILNNFFKFFSSSILSALLDLGVAWFLLDLLRNSCGKNDFLRIALATCIARIISMFANYTTNKKIVFNDRSTQNNSFGKYIFLCILIMFLSTVFVYISHYFFHCSEKLTKVLVDSLLFLLSYKIQQIWVFNKSTGGHQNV